MGKADGTMGGTRPSASRLAGALRVMRNATLPAAASKSKRAVFDEERSMLEVRAML